MIARRLALLIAPFSGIRSRAFFSSSSVIESLPFYKNTGGLSPGFVMVMEFQFDQIGSLYYEKIGSDYVADFSQSTANKSIPVSSLANYKEFLLIVHAAKNGTGLGYCSQIVIPNQAALGNGNWYQMVTSSYVVNCKIGFTSTTSMFVNEWSSGNANINGVVVQIYGRK